MLNNLTSTLEFQGQALSLRAERQRLLASNIANADTPGYVAKDMNFSQALREATGSPGLLSSARVLSGTSLGHIGTAMNSRGPSNLVYSNASQTSLDSNSVDMDRERASFTDNSVKYEATLRFINGSVRTMLDAIRGQ
jgi:flagellar basal-body rod protein FlgB